MFFYMPKEIKSKSKFEWKIVSLVKDRRTYLKISQGKIAKRLNVTRGYIGQIEMETSRSMYTYDQLDDLSSYLECSPKDFMPENPIAK